MTSDISALIDVNREQVLPDPKRFRCEGAGFIVSGEARSCRSPWRLVILTAALPSRLGNMEHARTAWFRLVLEAESSCALVVYGGVVGPTAVYRY
jgi:hypothetical protein